MSRIYGIAKMAYQAVKPIKERCAAKAVCRYYKNSKDAQIRKAVSYVKKAGRIQTFNAPFAEAYKSCFYKIKKDPGSGLFFVNYRGRPMYFSRDYFTVKSCLKYMRSILAEQDLHSPHRYLTDGFAVDAGSVVVDAGVAEGNFSLDIVDRASRLILVECNQNWIEALHKTFAKEIATGKVEIVPKMLGGGKSGRKHTSIDALYRKYGKLDFIKMDIEGGEADALRGGRAWMRESTSAKLAVCAYHKPEAFAEITNMLEGMFEVTHSRGYMYFNPIFRNEPPYFRRGLIRAVKKPDAG